MVKKTKAKVTKAVVTRGKRKQAIARAVVKSGRGNVTLNNISIDCLHPYIKNIIYEPLELAGENISNTISIAVNVRGGGVMSQADAARNAIARAIVEYTGDEALKDKYLKTNRFLLVEDYRRTEPKKYLGPKARARYQKSYR